MRVGRLVVWLLRLLLLWWSRFFMIWMCCWCVFVVLRCLFFMLSIWRMLFCLMLGVLFRVCGR